MKNYCTTAAPVDRFLTVRGRKDFVPKFVDQSDRVVIHMAVGAEISLLEVSE